MKYNLLALAAIFSVATASSLTEDQYAYLFTRFTKQYQKSYESKHYAEKYATFKSNLDIILSHNAQNLSYSMGINKFADLTRAEFMETLGLKTTLDHQNPKQNSTDVSEFVAVDWIEQGKVAAPKDQGRCGSCWAFSTLGSLEPAMRIAGLADISLDLSEQFLVDCSGSTGNEGCSGGLMSAAFDYIKRTGGVPSTKDYRYTGRNGICKKDAKIDEKSKISDYMAVSGDEGLMGALLNGPVSVAVDASSTAFQFYTQGTLRRCPNEGLNHAVVLVGTGTEANSEGETTQYYLVRNSWGTDWGDRGNIKLEFGTQQCGLGTSNFDVQPRL